MSIKDVRGGVKGVKSSPVGWAGIKKEEGFRQSEPCREHEHRAGNGHWNVLEMGTCVLESRSLDSNLITIFSKSLHYSMPQFLHQEYEDNSINLIGL